MEKQFRCDECHAVIGCVEENAEIMAFDVSVGITIKCGNCKKNPPNYKNVADDFDNELLRR